MAKTRDIRKRIISVRNIHKITGTMERVAQSKVIKVSNKFEAARAFRARVQGLLPEALGSEPTSLEATQDLAMQPLGARRSTVKRVLLFCVTSSRGLCGSYNTRMIHAVQARMRKLAGEGKEPLLAVVGKKGLAYFRFHNQPVLVGMPDADEHITYARMDDMARSITEGFAAKEFDAVEIVSTRYKTKALHEIRTEDLLPFVVRPAEARTADTHGPVHAAGATGPTPGPDGSPLYLVEPSHAIVLASLVPLLVKAELFCTVLEAMLCEQNQRSIAMRSASDNAESMTKQLQRTYNRARQAQITNEMIEIISGSEGGRT